MVNDSIQRAIAVLIVLGLLGILVLWTFYPPKSDGPFLTLLITLASALAVNVATVVGFYFGSSKGSAMKDAALVSAVEQVKVEKAKATEEKPNGHS